MEIDPDNPPSLDEELLTPYEHQVKDHWKECYASAVEPLRARGGEAALEQAVRNATHRAQTHAAAEAEIRTLIAQLKWRHADPGTVGVPNEEFLDRRPDLVVLPPFDAVKDPRDAATVPAVFPVPPSTPARAEWDAVHKRIAKEMDAAFVKNVAKNRAIQDQKTAARVSADVLAKIDREMNAAFVKNVAKNRAMQAEKKASRKK